MPRGPTVTAIGMWVADAARDHCKECHKNFGFFTRRHHCRRCGDIFCSKDSDFWSRDIPELPEYREREALRVCRSCFMHHLCHMVVHRGRFGLKYELFGSNYEAQAYFDKLKSGRLLMHVRSGNLLQCSADSERIRESLVNRAQGARNMLLGGHDIAPLLQPEGDRQSRLSFIVDSPGRVPIGTHHMVFCAQLIATGAWSHTVIECATGPQRADMIARFEEQFKLSNQLKRAVVYPARDYSTPLSVKGSGVLNLTLASTIVAESRKHLNSVPYLVIYHIAGKCQSMKCANLIDGFTQLEKMPNDCPCMLIAPSFDVVAKRRCDLPSFEEAMLTFAGEQLLAALNIPQVAVISNYAAPSITTNMYTARYAAKAILASSGPVYVAIIGIPTSQSGTNSPLSASSTQGSRSPRPSPLQTTSLTPDTPAVMLWNSFNQDPTGWFVQPSVVMSLVQITKATELLRDALRRAAEPRDVSPRADGPMTVPDARALVCECCICMDMYDVQNRRPVVCPECGNTICLTCWRQTPKCPSCRSNRSANPTFCIPLIQLLAEP